VLLFSLRKFTWSSLPLCSIRKGEQEILKTPLAKKDALQEQGISKLVLKE
jgi:hypothetical protein